MKRHPPSGGTSLFLPPPAARTNLSIWQEGPSDGVSPDNLRQLTTTFGQFCKLLTTFCKLMGNSDNKTPTSPCRKRAKKLLKRAKSFPKLSEVYKIALI